MWSRNMDQTSTSNETTDQSWKFNMNDAQRESHWMVSVAGAIVADARGSVDVARVLLEDAVRRAGGQCPAAFNAALDSDNDVDFAYWLYDGLLWMGNVWGLVMGALKQASGDIP